MLCCHFGVLFVESSTIKELIISVTSNSWPLFSTALLNALVLADSGAAARSKFARLLAPTKACVM
jgi:hypothetical protein